jgi:D-arabinose 1-dehydrogenase-like Zn-dependent alcohol dehydrogenase
MRAAVLRRFGSVDIDDVPDPVCGPTGVVIGGHEFSGFVSEVGTESKYAAINPARGSLQ